ncbi:MAG: hypothetical protein ACK4SS_00860 [Cypionkella sp.]
MKKILISTLALPTAAFGHAGHHGGGALDGILHGLTQPDHMLMVVIGVIVAYAAYRLIKGAGQ